jgi:hypothetical protein
MSQTVPSPSDEMSPEARRLAAELEQASRQTLARWRRMRARAGATEARVQMTIWEAIR